MDKGEIAETAKMICSMLHFTKKMALSWTNDVFLFLLEIQVDIWEIWDRSLGIKVW